MSATEKPAWQREPIVLAIANALLDRVDRGPKDRVRSPRLRLDSDTIPGLFAGSARECDYQWSLIEKLAQAGWVRIITDPNRSGDPGYYCNPRVELRDEAGLRELATRVRDLTPSWHHQFLTRLAELLPPEHPALDPTLSSGLPLQGYDPAVVAERLLGARALLDEPLLLREVASRLFFAQSKALDGNESLIAAVLGQPECPFPSMPLQLSVHLPAAEFTRVLFVENWTTFESLARRRPESTTDLALIYASGYLCSAKRLRMRDGASVYFAASALPSKAEVDRFEAWLLQKGPRIPVAFYGDLDFAGMSILARLRGSFEGAEAWEPGYEMLLRLLQADGGHTAEAARKTGQRDPGATGSQYADCVLLPAIRQYGRFVDQEGS
ncbi:MAG: uncharacterized protein JWO52_8134 [Gammaproteobacteria bacterium]|nr:uncharacterized protein [Gammaproteobacteria bacterium]